MLLVKSNIILVALVIWITKGEEVFKSKPPTKHVGDIIRGKINFNSKEIDDENKTPQTGLNNSQSIRRSRYLRMVRRPWRRPPPPPPPPPPPMPFPQFSRGIRRPVGYMNSLQSKNYPNPIKLNRPPKSRYRNYAENSKHMWPSEPISYSPYSDDDEMEQIPYDEYDEMEGDYKNEDMTRWYTKKHRGELTPEEQFEDVIPMQSKYNAKRSPIRYLSDLHSSIIDPPRAKIRPNYDIYDNDGRDDLTSTWSEKNRLSKIYKRLLESIMSPEKKLEKLINMYDDSFPTRYENHRFRLPSSVNKEKHFDDDDFKYTTDNAQANAIKYNRYRTDKNIDIPRIRPLHVDDDLNNNNNNNNNNHNNNYDTAESRDISKHLKLNLNYPMKNDNTQEVVYSAKYKNRNIELPRQNNYSQKDTHDDTKLDQNIIHSSHFIDSTNNDERNDRKHSNHKNSDVHDLISSSNKNNNDNYDRNNFDQRETSASFSNMKNDHLTANDLIAYMSADPSESVVSKGERTLHTKFPSIEKFAQSEAIKFPYYKALSPIIDQDLEITFDESFGN